MYSMNFLKKQMMKANRAALAKNSVDGIVPFFVFGNSFIFVCKG